MTEHEREVRLGDVVVRVTQRLTMRAIAGGGVVGSIEPVRVVVLRGGAPEEPVDLR